MDASLMTANVGALGDICKHLVTTIGGESPQLRALVTFVASLSVFGDRLQSLIKSLPDRNGSVNALAEIHDQRRHSLDMRVRKVQSFLTKLRAASRSTNVFLTAPREDMLGALAEFGRVLVGVESSLHVTFDGEEGVETGDPVREFMFGAFDAAMEHLFEDGGCGQRLPRASADPSQLEAFGKLLVKCVFDQVPLHSLHMLPLPFFRFLLVLPARNDPSAMRIGAPAWWLAHKEAVRVSLDDLSRFAGAARSAHVHRVRLLDAGALDELKLDHADGAPLSLANREEYVRWAAFEQLFGPRWEAMCAVWRGYHHASAKHIHAATYSLFMDELPLLLTGLQWGSMSMRELLAIEGVVQFSDVPEALQRTLHAALSVLSSLETRQLLQFATGSNVVPLRPSAALLRFVYAEHSPPNGLFVASTCARTVHVCPFDAENITRDVVYAKLLFSMELGGGRFAG